MHGKFFAGQCGSVSQRVPQPVTWVFQFWREKQIGRWKTPGCWGLPSELMPSTVASRISLSESALFPGSSP